MLIFSLAGFVLGIATRVPFFIPALTCLVPYYLGLTLRPKERASN